MWEVFSTFIRNAVTGSCIWQQVGAGVNSVLGTKLQCCLVTMPGVQLFGFARLRLTGQRFLPLPSFPGTVVSGSDSRWRDLFTIYTVISIAYCRLFLLLDPLQQEDPVLQQTGALPTELTWRPLLCTSSSFPVNLQHNTHNYFALGCAVDLWEILTKARLLPIHTLACEQAPGWV